MDSASTIVCSCGCISRIEFQNSFLDHPPVCPECGSVMNNDSWKSLREIMASIVDFNQHIVKWNLERGEPKMIVPAITVTTFHST